MNIPNPPSWLTASAVPIYMDTFKALGSQGVATDSSCVADFAQAQADCEEWTQVVRWEGEVLFSDKGNAYTSPRYTNLMSRRKDLERYRDDLGMTPKARKVVLKGPLKASIKDKLA